MNFSFSSASLRVVCRRVVGAVFVVGVFVAGSGLHAQLLAPPSSSASAASPLASAATDWSRSLVNVEVTFKQPDAFQPWNEPTRAIRKHGIVIGEREVLTTAQYLPTHTLVRLQKGGRGRWVDARVKWWDAQSNLALLTTDVAAFWEGQRPAELLDKVPPGPEFGLVRWRDGNLENRRVEFSKFTVAEGVLGFAPHLLLEVGTDLGGLGWAEIVVSGGKVAGITGYGSSRTSGVIPSSFIRRVLAAQRAGDFSGLGYFDFTWQPGSNPELLAELGLKGEPRGAIVHAPGRETDPAKAPQPRDILLEIDGLPIDVEGDYRDPDYGYLQLENLPNRARFAGETIPIKLLRDGREQTISYTIPAAKYEDMLVPAERFAGPPPYVVAGGLVFQPLAQPFLRGWGDDWRKYAPFRLQYYQYQEAADDRPSLVVLSGVLPDPINLGYQNDAMLVVDKVNGRRISTLAELTEALAKPSEGGVHMIEFMPGLARQRLLLDAATLDAATKRVVERYGIPAATRL